MMRFHPLHKSIYPLHALLHSNDCPYDLVRFQIHLKRVTLMQWSTLSTIFLYGVQIIICKQTIPVTIEMNPIMM